MSAFQRLENFFASSKEVDVVAAPSKDRTISYASEFASKLKAASKIGVVGLLMAAQMSSVFAATSNVSGIYENTLKPHLLTSQTLDRASIPNSFVRLPIEKAFNLDRVKGMGSLEGYVEADRTAHEQIRSDLMDIAQLHAKYAGHGRSDTETVVRAEFVSEDKETMPVAHTGLVPGKCMIDGVRTDYERLTSYLGQSPLLGTPEMRAFLMAHEDMHCRLVPHTAMPEYAWVHAALQAGGQGQEITGEMVGRWHTAMIHEAVADSMAILIIARRDGLEVANRTLDQVKQVRAENGEKARDYRVQNTLDSLRDILSNHPEKYSSDAKAFQTAIETGIKSQSATFLATASPKELDLINSEAFRNVADQNIKGLTEAAAQYTSGTYNVADTKIWMHGISNSASVAATAETMDKEGPEINAIRLAVESTYAELQDGAAHLYAKHSGFKTAPGMNATMERIASNVTLAPALPSVGFISKLKTGQNSSLRKPLVEAAPLSEEVRATASSPTLVKGPSGQFMSLLLNGSPSDVKVNKPTFNP